MTKRATADERRYMGLVAELGCCICNRPAEIHHITTGVGMSQRASNYDIIPLCPHHHRHGPLGEAIHAGKRTWEHIHGSELDYRNAVRKVLGYTID